MVGLVRTHVSLISHAAYAAAAGRRRVVDFDNEVDLKTGDIYNSFTVWRTIIFSDRLRMFLSVLVRLGGERT
jgi:hypothetical protein